MRGKVQPVTTTDESHPMSNSPPPQSIPDPRFLGKLFYTLGDESGNRMAILCLLLKSESTPSQIASTIGLSESATSQQLSKLKDRGLVTSRKGENQTKIYSITEGTIRSIVDAVNTVLAA